MACLSEPFDPGPLDSIHFLFVLHTVDNTNNRCYTYTHRLLLVRRAAQRSQCRTDLVPRCHFIPLPIHFLHDCRPWSKVPSQHEVGRLRAWLGLTQLHKPSLPSPPKFNTIEAGASFSKWSHHSPPSSSFFSLLGFFFLLGRETLHFLNVPKNISYN